MYTIIYFSPTGNTYHLAKKLKSNLGENTELFRMEFLDVDILEKNDHLILMFPIHGFNAPRTVKRFVKNLPENLYKSISILAVGCNEIWVNDAVSLYVNKVLKYKNYSIVLDEVLAMPLTFIMAFPDETNKQLFDKADLRIFEMAQKIKSRTITKRVVSFKSKLLTFVGKAESPAARMFGLELHATKNCTSCSICWNNCPEYNIKENKNHKPKFGFKCSMCMRCIYDCPTRAITPYISKFFPIKNGYKVLD